MFSSSKIRHLLQLFIVLCLTGLVVISPLRPSPVWADEPTIAPNLATLQGCGGPVLPTSNATFEQEVVQLTNRIRLDHGLPPLKVVDSLTHAARFHATDMSEDNYFSHTSYDWANGELVQSCSWSDRLVTYYADWQSLSENIAAGYSTPAAVVDGWMNSEGHRKNILSPSNWEIGVGYFEGSGTYGRYWVQDFGRRWDIYPVILNGDAATTDDGLLKIHIYGEWDEARLRIDQGDWSAWQPFALPLEWALKATVGEHSVTVEMRTESATASASDTIYLTQNTAEPQLNALPDSLFFVYNLVDDTISPQGYSIQPLAVAADSGYTWRVTTNAPWLNISPSEGSSTEVVNLAAVLSNASEGNEQAVVTVSLGKNDGTVVAEKQIAVSLAVIEANFSVFMPLVSQ